MTKDEWTQLGAHLLTSAGTIVVLTGAMSAGDTQRVIDAIKEIGTAATAISIALGTIAATVGPLISKWKSSAAQQKLAVKEIPGTLVVETSPSKMGKVAVDIAATVPGVQQVLTTQQLADATPDFPNITAKLAA